MTPDVPVFDGDHFDELYRRSPDPWSVHESWYERRKLALVLAALPRERYPRALEVGSSIGVTTRALAARCDDLLGLDASVEALRAAGREVAGLPGVRLRQATVPAEMPRGRWDLVVLGEVGYFLAPADLERLVESLPAHLAPGGDLVAVHWRRDADRLPVGGDVVHELLRALPLRSLVSHVEDDFLLEVWRAPAPPAEDDDPRPGGDSVGGSR